MILGWLGQLIILIINWCEPTNELKKQKKGVVPKISNFVVFQRLQLAIVLNMIVNAQCMTLCKLKCLSN